MRPTRTVLTVLLAVFAASLSTLPGSAAFAATPSDPPVQDAPADSAEEPVNPAPTDPAPADPSASDGTLPLLPNGGEQPAPTEPADTEPTDVSGGALPLLPDPETPAVARDVGVEELPLLVTEPPKEQAEVTIPAPVTGGGDSTLNPFSPLLLPQAAEPAPPPAPPVAAPPAPPQPPVAAPPTSSPTAPVPSAPAAATPAPRPAAPVPPARAARPTLPKSLGASLRAPASATGNPETGPLGRALGVQSAGTALGPPSTLSSTLSSTLAAVRVPSSLTPLGTAPIATATATPIPGSAQQVALGSGLTALGLGTGSGPSDGNFTSLGGNRVSRALSSLQVHFTAMTTGTAIFRVGDGTTPVLLALGEALPGTKLTLTNFTNRGAQFTEDDVRHTLLLSP